MAADSCRGISGSCTGSDSAAVVAVVVLVAVVLQNSTVELAVDCVRRL